ncbi:MAG: hypothetical protein OEV93_00580 [Candidatus Moranbacteria bacterium]|nr:hypothetical protein [Candidatus Moranbacteria bacterium]
MKNFDSGIRTSVVVAILISLNFAIFAHMFGMDVLELLNPKRYTDNSANVNATMMEEKIRDMTKGYPIEEMAQYISREDEQVAAFLVSIAKKESNWGKRSPKLNGKDCYNYWGFRQKREKMGTGGHTCFDNPREAVKVVANRIEELIENGVDNPADMIVWKCGSSCQTHSEVAVKKWINDVDLYYKRFYN